MHGSNISIWFFIGVLLTIYGVMIFGYGCYELISGNLAPVVLNYLHAPVWWGAILLTLGLFWCFTYRPGKTN